MDKVTLEIPDELLAKFKNDSGEAGRALRLAAAFFLCRRGELSTSQAARLAGMAYADFLDAAARAKVELFPINDDEIKEEIRIGYTLGRQCVAGNPVVPRGSA
jgi:hypothetical protein